MQQLKKLMFHGLFDAVLDAIGTEKGQQALRTSFLGQLFAKKVAQIVECIIMLFRESAIAELLLEGGHHFQLALETNPTLRFSQVRNMTVPTFFEGIIFLYFCSVVSF